MRGANKPLFLIGIPTYGQHSFLFTQSLLGEIMPSNFSMQLRFIPGMEVGLARNILLQEARNMGCEYIMFRDEDTIAPANLVINLLQLLETHPDWTFAGGLYATKTRPPEPLVYTDWGTGPFYNFKRGELIPIKFTGMGASLIRMSDLDSIKTEILFDKNPWTGEPMEVREFFRTVSANQVKPGGVDKIASTEDAFFFRKLRGRVESLRRYEPIVWALRQR